jgi:arylsulfatase A-like enzyme
LSVSIFRTKAGFPSGDAVYSDTGELPKMLKPGNALVIQFAKPVDLQPGDYAIVFESKASKLRFDLAEVYRHGTLIKKQGGKAWGNGAKSDLVFALPGSGIEVSAGKRANASAATPRSDKPNVSTPPRAITLIHDVSTNVTPLVDMLPERPNIVTCMVDDLGWNQISVPQSTMGTHHPEFATPTLEMLAKKGLSFTHAYAQPNCAPTRAAMLSGQYPARIHNDVYVVGSLNRNGRGGISKEKARFLGPKQTEDVAAEAITVAEAMKQNGYATAHIGKYHVGGHDGDRTLPENVGFDINIGGYSQGHQPTCFSSKKADAWAFKGLGRGHFDRFGEPYTQAYVKKYGFPASLVGKPKHVSDAVGDAMEESVGKLHATGKPFYLQLHPYAVHGPVKSRPDLKAKYGSDLAGFIHSIDLIIARLLIALEDPNGDGDTADSVAANTLILFTSDNGGTHGNNQPLRGKKGMLNEGGVRVPLIAYWPGVIPPNTVTDYMVHSVDYYPTYLQLAGRKWMPPEAEHPLDGESFADILRKPDLDRRRGPILYLFPGYMDTRAQPSAMAIDELGGKRYKLLYYYEADSWELYNITDDIGEASNLFQAKPELASSLSKTINKWLTKQHSTWKPKYPITKATGKPAGPPPVL